MPELELPKIATSPFTVNVSVLDDPELGRLVIETDNQIRDRFKTERAPYEDALEDAKGTEKEAALASAVKALDRLEKNELKLYGELRKARKSDIQTFKFIFTCPTVGQVEEAEAGCYVAAPTAQVPSGSSSPSEESGGSKTPQIVRSEARFRRLLMAATFISSDYPGMDALKEGGFEGLDATIASILMATVAQRSALSKDARLFFRK